MNEARAKPVVSVVIPLYRSAATVVALVQSVSAVLDQRGVTYEVILVDDGSPDDTWDHVIRLLPGYCHVRGLRLTRNFGQQSALGIGLERSRGNWVVIMDADLQDDPANIPALLDAASEGYDIVLAQWRDAVGTRSARWSSRLFYRVFNRLTGVHLPQGTGSYRVMSRRVVDQFLALPDRTDFLGGMVAWFGFPTTTVPVVRREREDGKSGYTLKRRLSLGASALVSFSTIPLKLAAVAGVIACAAAVFAGLAVALLRITGVITQAGYAGIMVVLLFMSGTILLSTGTLGFYLGSLIKTTSRRPVAVIGTDTGIPS